MFTGNVNVTSLLPIFLKNTYPTINTLALLWTSLTFFNVAKVPVDDPSSLNLILFKNPPSPILVSITTKSSDPLEAKGFICKLKAW